MATLTELGAFALFQDLERDHLAQVAATARDVRYRTGDRLFDEGTPAWGCWLITSGRVALDDGTSPAVESLSAGDVLGWSWLVPPYRWHFTATAVTDVTAILLDTDRLKNFTDADPSLGHAVTKALFAVLLSRLQATRARLSASPPARPDGADR
ncbi:cyclic nucleotide-binding domain-containing protein [Phytomonospora sp. NPDC050363]|uniref:cyclic nucleotide-binding domain-containing protein n=1 Tax=Phytomonospora sp. NPDC050363 TaxID=3155642 RepID=UPI0033DC5523